MPIGDTRRAPNIFELLARSHFAAFTDLVIKCAKTGLSVIPALVVVTSSIIIRSYLVRTPPYGLMPENDVNRPTGRDGADCFGVIDIVSL